MNGVRLAVGVFALASCTIDSGVELDRPVGGTDGDETGGDDASDGEPFADLGDGDGDGDGDADGAQDLPPVENEPPVLVLPAMAVLVEEEDQVVLLDVLDPTSPDVRLWVTGLPPGAFWDEPSRTIGFRPDFTQGGEAWVVNAIADDGEFRETASFVLEVEDSITPPEPSLDPIGSGSSTERYELLQTTDDFLDSPGYAGRTLVADLTVPKAASAEDPVPVRIVLHGFGGGPSIAASSSEIRLAPDDPMNTYWYGYSDQLPDGEAATGMVPPYTQRRVLHLMDWVLENVEGADPERVYVSGGSMGGAGAATIGLLHARHFAWVRSTIGQMVAANHRPARMAQLEGLWGSLDLDLDDGAGMGVWTRQDLSRALFDDPEARDQFLFTKHGKDDATIHFGAVTQGSPLTGLSYYETAQAGNIGHYAVWDEGGHGSNDPVMDGSWWDEGWNPILDGDDEPARLRRDTAFVAFSHASHDRDHGGGDGNGNQSWSDSSGYAGSVSVPGDTGWGGDIAGALNRFLRWDIDSVVDTVDSFEIAVSVRDGEGADPPAADYPTQGDRFQGELPVFVDLTPRRMQAFRCRPGEIVVWTFGEQSGEVQADEQGAVTVPQLPVDTGWTTLVLERQTD